MRSVRRPITPRLRIDTLEDRVTPGAGQLDATFSGDGRVALDFGPVAGATTSYASVLQPDGKLVSVGSGPGNYFFLMRFDATGGLDPTFSNGALDTVWDGGDGMTLVNQGANGAATDVALQPDGKIVAAGSRYVLRLTASGQRDATFGTNGLVTIPQVGPTTAGTFAAGGVVVQADGKIVLGGYANMAATGAANYDFVAIRLNANGTLDSTFDADGIQTVAVTAVPATGDDRAQDVTLDGDGKIVLAGYGTSTQTGQDMAVVRLNPNGSVDTSFDTDGIVTVAINTGSGAERATEVIVQPDGKLVLAGSSRPVGSFIPVLFAAVRLNPTGTLDTTFSGDGIQVIAGTGDSGSAGATAAALLPDGRLALTGSIPGPVVGGVAYHDFGVAVLKADGTAETAFSGDGVLVFEPNPAIGAGNALRSSAIHATAAGKLLVSGSSQVPTSVARLNLDGTFDTAYGTNGITNQSYNNLTSDLGNAVALAPGGKIVVAGTTSFGSVASGDFSVARLNADGTPDTTFGGDGTIWPDISGQGAANAVVVQPDGKILVAGASDAGVKAAVVRFNDDGTFDTTFNGTGKVILDLFTTNDVFNAIVLQSDGKILLGGSTGSNSAYDMVVVRLNPNGTLDSSFNGTGVYRLNLGSYEYVYALAVQPDGKIVAAGYTGSYAAAVARLNPDGTPDSTFDGDGSRVFGGNGASQLRNVDGIALQADGKIVLAGNTINGSGTASYGITRLNADGSWDTSFDGDGTRTVTFPGLSSNAHGVAIDAVGRIVVGGSSGSDFSAARLLADGTLDTSFDADGLVTVDFRTATYGYTLATTNDVASGLVLQPDGNIVLAGSVNSSSGPLEFGVARLEGGGLPPTDIQLSNGTIPENAPVNTTVGTLTSTDPNPGDTFTYTLVGGAGSTNNAQFTIAGNQLKTNAVFDHETQPTRSVRIRSTDAGGNIYEEFFTIAVSDVNDVPTLTGFPLSRTTPEDTPVTIDANATDPDVPAQTLTFAIASQPGHGTLSGFNAATGVVTYTPAADYTGADSFTMTVSDGALTSPAGTVNLTMTAVNDPPVAVGNTYSTAEDTPLTLAAPGVLDNDTDPDGDALTAAVVANPTHGTLSLAANGGFTYTPAANYTGPDSFTYRANDGTANSNTVTVNLTVTAVNDVPVAANNSYPVVRNTPLTIAAPGVLGNDTDADGDPLTAVPGTGPTHGVLDLNPDGSFTYTPAANYTGPDSFTYRANDGTANSNLATVAFTVTSTNDPPVAVGNSYTAVEDTPLTIAAPGVLGNDSDPNGDPLTAVLVSGPTHGTVSLAANGGFTYTPAANYFGPDSFTYRATDGSLTSNLATVSLSVASVNDVPVAVANSYTTAEDTPVTVAAPGLLANDTDADGDPLTAALVSFSGPAHGTLSLSANGGFTYTPDANYNGPDSFRYRAGDGTALSNIVTVNLSVSSVNDAPVVDAGADRAVETFLPAVQGATVSDADVGDTLTYAWQVVFQGSVVASGSAPTIAFTPLAAGPYTLTLTVTDLAGASDSDAVVLTATPVPPGDVPNRLPDAATAPQALFAAGPTRLTDLAIGGGRRLFRFTTDGVAADDGYTFKVSGTRSGVDVALGLYDVDGNLLGKADSGSLGTPGQFTYETLTTTRIRPQTAYVLGLFTATTDPTVKYTLDVTPAAQKTNPTIAYRAATGDVTYAATGGEDRLDGPADVDYYPLDLLGAGASGTVTVTPAAGTDVAAFVTVFRRATAADPWAPVGTGQAPRGAAISVALPPAAGKQLTDAQFLLAVAPGNFDTAARSYTVRVAAPALVPAVADTPGVSLQMLITAPGVVGRGTTDTLAVGSDFRYAVQAPLAGTLKVGVSAATFDPVVSVYQGGVLIAARSLTRSGVAQPDLFFDVPVAVGRVVIRVADAGGNDGGAFTLAVSGTYEPSAADLSAVDGPPIVPVGAVDVGPSRATKFYRITPRAGTDVVAVRLTAAGSGRPFGAARLPDGRIVSLAAPAGQPVFVPLDLAGAAGPIDLFLTSDVNDRVTLTVGQLAFPDRLDPDAYPGVPLNLDTGDLAASRTAGAFGTGAGLTFFHLIPPAAAVNETTTVKAENAAARPLLALYEEQAGALQLVQYVFPGSTGLAEITRRLTPDKLYALAAFPLSFDATGATIDLSVAGPKPEGVQVRMVSDPLPDQPVTGGTPPTPQTIFTSNLLLRRVTFEAEYQQHLWQSVFPQNLIDGSSTVRPKVTYTPNGDLGVRIQVYADGVRIDLRPGSPTAAPVPDVTPGGGAATTFYLNAPSGTQTGYFNGKTIQFRVTPLPGQLDDGTYKLELATKTTNPYPFEASEYAWDLMPALTGVAPQVRVNTAGGTPDKARHGQGAAVGTVREVVQNQFGDGSIEATFGKGSTTPNTDASVDVYRFRHVDPAQPLAVRTEALDGSADTSLRLYRAVSFDGKQYLMAVELADMLNPVTTPGVDGYAQIDVAGNLNWFPADRDTIDAQVYIRDPGLVRVPNRFDILPTGEPGTPSFKPGKFMTSAGTEYYAVVKTAAGAAGQYRLVVEAGPTGPYAPPVVTIQQKSGAADPMTAPSAAVVNLPNYHTGNLVVTGPAGGLYDIHVFDAAGARLAATTQDFNTGSAANKYTRATITVPAGAQVLTLRAYLRGAKAGTATDFTLQTSFALPATNPLVVNPPTTIPATAVYEPLPVGPTGDGSLTAAFPSGQVRWYRFASGTGPVTVTLTSTAGTFRVAGYSDGQYMGKSETAASVATLMFGRGNGAAADSELDVPFSLDGRQDVMLYVQQLTGPAGAEFTLAVDSALAEPLRQHELFLDPLNGSNPLRFEPGLISTEAFHEGLQVSTAPVRNGDWQHAAVQAGNVEPVQLTLTAFGVGPGTRVAYAVYDSAGARVASGTAAVPTNGGLGGTVSVPLPNLPGGASYDVQAYRLDQPTGHGTNVVGAVLYATYPSAKTTGARPQAWPDDTDPHDTARPGEIAQAVPDPAGRFTKTIPFLTDPDTLDPGTGGSIGFWVGGTGKATFTTTLISAGTGYVALYRARLTQRQESMSVFDYVLYDYANTAANGKYVLTADLDPGYYLIRGAGTNTATLSGMTVAAELPTPRAEALVLNPIFGNNAEPNFRIYNRSIGSVASGNGPLYTRHLIEQYATRYYAVQTPGGSQAPMSVAGDSAADADGDFGAGAEYKVWSPTVGGFNTFDDPDPVIGTGDREARITGVEALPLQPLVVTVHRAGTAAVGKVAVGTLFAVPDSGTPDLSVGPIELFALNGRTMARTTVRNRGNGLALAGPATLRISDDSQPAATRWQRLDQMTSVLSPGTSQTVELIFDPVTPQDTIAYTADDRSEQSAHPSPIVGQMEEVSEDNNRQAIALSAVDPTRPRINSITMADPLLDGTPPNDAVWGRYVAGVDGTYTTVGVVTSDLDDEEGKPTTLYRAVVDFPAGADQRVTAPAAFNFPVDFGELDPTDAAHPNAYVVTVTDVWGLTSQETRTAQVVPLPSWATVGNSELTFDRATHTYDLFFEKYVVDFRKTVSELLLGDGTPPDEIPFIGPNENAFVVRIASTAHAPLTAGPDGDTVIGESQGYALLKILDEVYFEEEFNGERTFGEDGSGVQVTSNFIFNRDDLSIETITGGVRVNDLELFNWESPEIKLFSYGVPGVASLNAVLQFGIEAELDAAATVAFDPDSILQDPIPLPVPEGLIAPTYIEPAVTLSATVSGELEVFGFDVASLDGTVAFTLYVAVGLGTPVDQVLSFADPEAILDAIDVEMSGKLQLKAGASILGFEVFSIEPEPWTFQFSDPDAVTGNEGAAGSPAPPVGAGAAAGASPRDPRAWLGTNDPRSVTTAGDVPTKDDVQNGETGPRRFELPPTPQLVIDPATWNGLYVQVTDDDPTAATHGAMKFATRTGANGAWSVPTSRPVGDHISNPVLARTGVGSGAVVTYLASRGITDPSAPGVGLKDFLNAQDVESRYWTGSDFEDPVPLPADLSGGRYDSDPAVAFNGSGVGVLAYTKNKLADPLTVIDPVTGQRVPGAYSRAGTEVYVSRWDAAGRKWGTPVRLTNDDTADGKAAVYVGADGTPYAVWLRDTTDGGNAMWYSRYTAGAWSTAAPLPTTGLAGGRISSVAVGSAGGDQIDVLFAHRGARPAVADRALVDQSVASAIYHRTTSAAAFGDPAGLGTMAANVSPSHLRIAPGGTGLTAYWQEANGVVGEVFATTLTPPGVGGGKWGRPLALTAGDTAEQTPSVALDADDTYQTVYWNKVPRAWENPQSGATRGPEVGVPGSDGVGSNSVRALPELSFARPLGFKNGNVYPAGGTATGSATVVNIGSEGTTVRIDYLTDGEPTAVETIVLGAGRSYDVRHPFTLLGGRHEYGVRLTSLAPGGEAFGADDNLSVAVVEGGLDLIASGGVSMSGEVRAGQLVTLKTTVEARGPRPTRDVRVAFVKYTTYRIPGPNGAETRRDKEILGYKFVSGASLATPQQVSFAWRLPADAESFELAAVVDPFDAFAEVSDFNNETGTGVRLWADPAVVTPRALAVPPGGTPPAAGQRLQATIKDYTGVGNVRLRAGVANLGRAPFDRVTVRVYWSWDGGPYQQVRELTLAPTFKEFSHVDVNVAGWAGVNRYRVVVDPGHAIPDADLTNNVAETQLYVRGFADLRPGPVSAPTGSQVQGGPFALTVAVDNTGIATAADVRVEVFARTPAGRRLWVGRADLPAIRPLGRATVAVPIDTGALLGSVTFEVVVDRFNKVTELSDRNNTLENALTRTFTADATPPTADVVDVSPDPRNTAVGTVEVVFSEPVTGFDLADVQLKRNGAVVALTGVGIEPLSLSRYRLTGLAARTGGAGQYALRIDAAGVRDRAGLAGVGQATDGWLLDTAVPTSKVRPLAAVQTQTNIALFADRSDPDSTAAPSSGLVSYDLYVSTDDGPYALWETVPAINPGATYPGASGHNYRFYSRARDGAGNVEAAPTTPDASTRVPDLDAPITGVTAAAPAADRLSYSWAGSDAGPGGLRYVDVFATVDGGAARRIDRHFQPAGTASASGAGTYPPIADGSAHTYRFYATGADGAGNLEPAPGGTTADVVVAATFAVPSGPLAVVGFDVQRGQRQRAVVRTVDVAFNKGAGLQALVDGVNSTPPTDDRIRLTKFGLAGTGGTAVGLAGKVSVVGTGLAFDFGSAGLADGYYRLEFDLDGDGTFETRRHFYRIQGDVNGDRIVTAADRDLVTTALGRTDADAEEDATGDGVVTAADQQQVNGAMGRKLGALPLDD